VKSRRGLSPRAAQGGVPGVVLNAPKADADPRSGAGE